VHLVAANVSSTQQLPANGIIQLAFDRLLLPSCITRQTFVLEMNTITPTLAYDPVARVVTITPPASALTPGQTYTIGIASPQSAGDPNGLRAIDGATLDPGSPAIIDFQVTNATSTAPPMPPTIDFCNDVSTTFSTCTGSGCHGSTLPAAGLLLTTAEGVAQTAIGRVAHGSNTGPRAASQPPSLLFGEDMPIIDPGNGGAGNPGDSWLLYKMLMAVPGPDPISCDGGTSPSATGAPGDGDPSEADAAVDGGGSGAAGDATVPSDATGGTTPDATTEAAAPSTDSGVSDEAGNAAIDAGDDAGAPAASTTALSNVCGLYSVKWLPLSPSEQATLANLVSGREMPFPSNLNLDAGPGTGSSVNELERISLWIAQGAPIPPGGCSGGGDSE